VALSTPNAAAVLECRIASSYYLDLTHLGCKQLKLLWIDIADLKRLLGHESISTTRLYAETTAATLQRRFDQLTDPAAHTLVASIRQRRSDDATLLAADLLARHRAERVTTADARVQGACPCGVGRSPTAGRSPMTVSANS